MNKIILYGVMVVIIVSFSIFAGREIFRLNNIEKFISEPQINCNSKSSAQKKLLKSNLRLVDREYNRLAQECKTDSTDAKCINALYHLTDDANKKRDMNERIEAVKNLGYCKSNPNASKNPADPYYRECVLQISTDKDSIESLKKTCCLNNYALKDLCIFPYMATKSNTVKPRWKKERKAAVEFALTMTQALNKNYHQIMARKDFQYCNNPQNRGDTSHKCIFSRALFSNPNLNTKRKFKRWLNLYKPLSNLCQFHKTTWMTRSKERNSPEARLMTACRINAMSKPRELRRIRRMCDSTYWSSPGCIIPTLYDLKMKQIMQDRLLRISQPPQLQLNISEKNAKAGNCMFPVLRNSTLRH